MDAVLQVLLLIIIANAAPVLMSYLFSHRESSAIDAGLNLPDGKRLFGPTKTWRGLIASAVMTIALAFLINLPVLSGLLISITAMCGDLTSSFIKRRLGYAPSSQVIVLDQLLESLFPAIAGSWFWPLDLMQVIIIVVSFLILEIVLSKLLYKIGVRKRPY